MAGVTRVPYRLLDILKSSHRVPVYLPEGEKDVDNLAHIGLTATTNSGGAGKWDDAHSAYLKGRHVIILPDNDDKGKEHAKKVAASLRGIAASVRIVELPNLPEKGDVSDWIAAGGTREQLVELTAPQKRKFLYASEIKPEPVEYTWDKRIARGMLTLFVGDPGLGKSMLIIKVVAAHTTGGMLPDGKAVTPGGVVIMAPEDSYQHTIVPRLIAAGADLTKIILLSEVTETDGDGKPFQRPISFPEDAPILEEAIEDCGAVLAIIDPVLAMINGKYDSHKDQDSRAALGRVLAVAQRQNCAVLGVFHLNKTQGGNVLYRSSASIAYIAMARIGLFLVPDPDNPENGRVLVNHKNNLAAKATPLCFTIEQTPEEVGYVQWQGASPYTEDQLLNQNAPTDNIKSKQELDIVAVLKSNDVAMTIQQIHPHTEQSIDALEKMLDRKVKQGVIIRPARGMYTYPGNPLYTPKPSMSTMSEMSPLSPYVNNVGTSNIATSDMSVLDNGSQAASNVQREQTDISDIDCAMIPSHNLSNASQNGPKPASHALCCTIYEDVRKSGPVDHHQFGQRIGTAQDDSGHWWCEQCIWQHDLMNIACILNYPKIKVFMGGKEYSIDGTKAAYLRFAQMEGYNLVKAALKRLEQMQEAQS